VLFVEQLRRALARARTDQERRDLLAMLTPDERVKLKHTWAYWARPKQLEPEALSTGERTTWLLMAGRGFGKSYTGSNWIIEKVMQGYKRIALVAETAADARDVMVEGPSGILAVAPPWCRPKYEPSKRRITWPNGAVATTFAAEKYEALRGPNHDCAWVDELAKYRYDVETYDQLQFTLRLDGPEDEHGDRRPPLTLITTTPRPTALIRDLVEEAKDPAGDVVLTTGSTYENRGNLASKFLKAIEKKYAGTRLGRQELHAEVLMEVDGALWTVDTLNKARLSVPELDPDEIEEHGWHEALMDALGITHTVVAVDPAVSSNENSDETGILVCGKTKQGQGIVLDDLSGVYTASEWARKAVDAYEAWGADHIVAEVNNGGDLVESNIRTQKTSTGRHVKVEQVRATRGKALRAEPVAALYEQHRVSHLVRKTSPDPGAPEILAVLEAQMTEWSPKHSKDSPDRLDAVVYGITDLRITGTPDLTVAGGMI
jgi:phage terminase large subunit-like protein